MSRGVPSLKEIESRSAAELSSWPSARPSSIRRRTRWRACACARVIERQPDHREARRLLGYVPHEGGWARPFAVQTAQGWLCEPPDFRLGARRLGAASRSWRAARAARQAGPEQGSLALRRRGRRPSRQLVTPRGASIPSTLKSRPTSRSPRRSRSAAGSRRFTTCSWLCSPTFSVKTCRWCAASKTRR